MYEPTTAWDRAPTDAELHGFYGKPKSTHIHDEIVEVLTETVRTVSASKLGLPYVKMDKVGDDYVAKLSMYPLSEVVTDYGTDPKPLAALLAVIEKSDCPHVAAFRLALAERYADSNADEVEELS